MPKPTGMAANWYHYGIGVCWTLLAGCTPLTYTTAFSGPAKPASAPTAGAIHIFEGTAPAGFRRHDGQVSARAGSGHRVLGRVLVMAGSGFCDLGNANRGAVLDALEARARAEGGNAVIFAASALEDETTAHERCDAPASNEAGAYGWGWVVRLSGQSYTEYISQAPAAAEVGLIEPSLR